MPAYHNCKLSVSGAQAYFSNLNSIAMKIACDVNDTKATYGDLWCTLTPNEQDEIINETLIRPEITIRYYENIVPATTTTTRDSLSTNALESTKTVANSAECRPVAGRGEARGSSSEACLPNYAVCDLRSLCNFNQLTIASKLVEDDNFDIYRDEHSAPFSYRTRSQINLTLFEDRKTEKRLTCMKSGFDDNQTHARLFPPRDSERNGKCEVAVWTSKEDDDQHTRRKLAQTEQESITYSPPPDDDKINLKFYFGARKKLRDSNSSVASTDDDDELEDKRLCTEKVKLLESDSDIRRGFDFLNNW